MKKFLKRGFAAMLTMIMAITSLTPVSYAREAVPEPILYYDFESADGSVIKDQIGEYDGALHGRAAIARDSDTGSGVLDLDGTTGTYATFPNGFFDGRDTFTLSMDIRSRMGATSGSSMYFFQFCIGQDGNTSRYLYFRNRVNGAHLNITTNSNGNEQSAGGSGTFPTDVWRNVVLVVQPGSMAVYIDGVLFAENNNVSINISALGTGLDGFLGHSVWSADPDVNGSYDNVAVYDEALSAGQIQSIYWEGREEEALQVLAADREATTIPGQTIMNLQLPDTGVNGSQITWSSDNSAISADGTVTQQEEDTEVLLTATFSLGQYAVTREYPVTVPGYHSDNTIIQNLVIPKYITGDLPGELGGLAVTWSSDVEDTVAADGTVTRPAPGEANKVVNLTASAGDTSISGQAEIVARGGRILSYVSKGGDLLAYPGSRRADALHVAAYDEETDTYEALNKGNAILYNVWTGGQQKDNRDEQMGSPTFFRKADGSLAVAASGNNNKDGIFIWDSNEDGVTFTGQRYLQVNTNGLAVQHPVVLYDAAAASYKVYWQSDGGSAYLSVFADLEAGAVPIAVVNGFYDRAAAEGTLPENAVEAEASVFEMNQEEYDRFTRKYAALRNTGVEEVVVRTEKGSTIELPETVMMEYSDGSTKNLGVSWDAEALAAIDTSKSNEYVISGSVIQDDYAYPFIEERADPHVFYNEDDGYYYSTGSYYDDVMDFSSEAAARNGSYRKLDIRRAETIAGLRNAEEHYILESEIGDQWGSFFWAPEFHKINGKWYCLVGAHNFGSAGIRSATDWGWCSSSILIPYEGTAEDIRNGGMLDKSQWGTPIVLNVSASFDVSYYEDSEGQGYYIIPSSNRLQIVKVQGGEGVVPQPVGSTVTLKTVQWPWEYGVQASTKSAAPENREDQAIVEGPYLFEYGDKVYISYSGATVDEFYCLGLMMADKGSDLMDPASWKTVDYPLLSSYDTMDGQIGGAAHVGGGHNSIVLDEYGNLALIYHARPYPDPHEMYPNIAGGLFDPCRNTAVKSINVAYDGQLVLNITSDEEVAPENKTVTATVIVASGELVYDGLDEVLKKADGLDMNQYTYDSWNRLLEAYNEAKAVRNNASQQRQLDEASQMLDEALEALDQATADPWYLKFVIGLAEDLKAEVDAAVPVVKTLFYDAYNAATAQLAAAEADARSTALKDTVETALTLLGTFKWLDYVLGDTTMLEQLLAEAQEILDHADEYVAESIEGLQELVDEATELLKDENLLDAEIIEMADRLEAAIDKAERKEDPGPQDPDRSLLWKVLQEAAEILDNIDAYRPSTVDGLKAAYDQAMAVYKDPEADQAAINEAVKQLTAETAKARMIPDKDVLAGLVNKAGKLNRSLYSAASLAKLDEAQAAAAAVLNNPDADEKEVKAAVILMQQALDNLKLKPEPEPEPEPDPAADKGVTKQKDTSGVRSPGSATGKKGGAKTGDPAMPILLAGIMLLSGMILFKKRKHT